jgi:hypothetical protein
MPNEPLSLRAWIDSLSEAQTRDLLERFARAAHELRNVELPQLADGGHTGKAIPEAHLPIQGVPPPVGKTAQVLRAMGQHDRLRVWTARELHDALVHYGWMRDSERTYASLLATLSRMVKEGMIHRPERGLYSIAPPEDIAAAQAARSASFASDG